MARHATVNLILLQESEVRQAAAFNHKVVEMLNAKIEDHVAFSNACLESIRATEVALGTINLFPDATLMILSDSVKKGKTK